MDDTDIAAAEQSVTTQESILGFEKTSYWTTSAGTIASTTTRSQGTAALSLKGFGSATLTSAPLSTLSGVKSALLLDVRLPAAVSTGSVGLSLSSGTLGISNVSLGRVILQGLPANSFQSLMFFIPSALKAKLQGRYSDLRIKVQLQVPTTTSAYILDNLRFADCGQSSAYALQVSSPAGFDPNILSDMKCTFFQVYPQLARRFNTSAAKTVGLTIQDQKDIAFADKGVVYVQTNHMLQNPLDYDVVTHEIMHIVQAGYPDGAAVGWIIEGTADYVRDAFGLNNAANGWSIPQGWSYGQHYAMGYGDAAAFFKWTDAKYRVGKQPLVDVFDDQFRANTYSAASWVTLTGKTVDNLWYEYSGNRAPLPATTGITVYEDAYFGGRGVMLDRGRYDVSDLTARGIGNDWLSSLRIPSGYTVMAYTDGGYGGEMVTYTSDVSYVGDALNDEISSIVVQ